MAPPRGDPGDLVVDPGLTFPVIDVTPCGGVGPSVTWMGNEALVCAEPSVSAPPPGVTVLDRAPGVGIYAVVAGQTVGVCSYPQRAAAPGPADIYLRNPMIPRG